MGQEKISLRRVSDQVGLVESLDRNGAFGLPELEEVGKDKDLLLRLVVKTCCYEEVPPEQPESSSRAMLSGYHPGRPVVYIDSLSLASVLSRLLAVAGGENEVVQALSFASILLERPQLGRNLSTVEGLVVWALRDGGTMDVAGLVAACNRFHARSSPVTLAEVRQAAESLVGFGVSKVDDEYKFTHRFFQRRW